MDGDLDLFLTGIDSQVQNIAIQIGNTKQKNTAPAQITGLIATDLTEKCVSVGMSQRRFFKQFGLCPSIRNHSRRYRTF
jgi:hypothetical protein